jgi:hypothetical protein
MRATTSAPSNSFSQTVLGTSVGPSGAPFLQVTAYCADNYGHGRTDTATFTVDAWTNKVPNTCNYDVRLTIDPLP